MPGIYSVSATSYTYSPSGEMADSRRAGQVDAPEQAGGAAMPEDQVQISARGRALAGSAQKARQAGQTEKGSGAAVVLTPAQELEVRQLSALDRTVRAHEQAHIAAGGSLVRGGASYSYRTGPDGKRYAVGGEVQIDTSAVKDDPDATIRKAARVRTAALAPAEPSAQDRAVASNADKLAMAAALEKAFASKGKQK